MMDVLLTSLGVDQNVISVSNNIIVLNVAEDRINKGLEHGAVWHDRIFIVPPGGDKRYLPFINL